MKNYKQLAEQYAKEKYPNDEIAQGWEVFGISGFAEWLKLHDKTEEKCPECGRIGEHSNSCVTVE